MMYAVIAAQIAAQVAYAAQEQQAWQAAYDAAPPEMQAGMLAAREERRRLAREEQLLREQRAHELAVAQASRPDGMTFALGVLLGVGLS